MLVLVDHFDSFTYNIAQLFQELGVDVCTIRCCDRPALETALADAQYLVLGPGPGTPTDTGHSLWALEQARGKMPILGICLGHQLIAEAFGAKVVRAERICHGVTSPIVHTGEGLFEGLPQRFPATRYHSLLVERSSLPPCLAVTAQAPEGEIMAFSHTDLPIHGLQFHPESIASERGDSILRNFIQY